MKKAIMCNSKLSDQHFEDIMDKIDDAKTNYEIDEIKGSTVYMKPKNSDKLLPTVTLTIEELDTDEDEITVSLDLNVTKFPNLNGKDSNYADYASGAIKKWLENVEAFEKICGKEIRLYK